MCTRQSEVMQTVVSCTDIRKWIILQTDECRYREESGRPCPAEYGIVRSTGVVRGHVPCIHDDRHGEGLYREWVKG